MSYFSNSQYYNIVYEAFESLKNFGHVVFEDGQQSENNFTIRVVIGDEQEKGSISLRYDYNLNLKDVHLTSKNIRQTYLHRTLDITEKIREAIVKVKSLYLESLLKHKA